MKLADVKLRLAAIPVESVTETDNSHRGFVLDIKVLPEQLVTAAYFMDGEGFFIESITGVDWLGEKVALQKEAGAKTNAETPAKQDTAHLGVQFERSVPQVDDIEVIYDFNHYDSFCRVVLRTRVPRDNPKVPTISHIYPGANWHERETKDFFGVFFVDHPNMTPLLLPEDADYHPLLKDYKP